MKSLKINYCEIVLEVPFSLDEAMKKMSIKDYGLYQVYGLLAEGLITYNRIIVELKSVFNKVNRFNKVLLSHHGGFEF